MTNLIVNGDFSNGTAGWRNQAGSLVLDSTVFDVATPSLKVLTTGGTGAGWYGAMSTRFPVQPGEKYFYTARVKGDYSGRMLEAFIDYYDQAGYIGGFEFDFKPTGLWQTISGTHIPPDGAVTADFGIYFWDINLNGPYFNLDNVYFGLADPTSLTPYQPVLPAEIQFTQAELVFMDESPPGLFPENQDSNFGFIVRKIFSDLAQDISNWQNTLYNEKFVETSTQFLDQWETDVGLVPNPAGISISQRRTNVLTRLRRGPFTRGRRNKVIEDYISTTFGNPIQLVPEGVAIPSDGIPIYGESGDITTLYQVYENIPGYSYLIWIASTNSPDLNALTRELQRITPAGISFTITNVHP